MNAHQDLRGVALGGRPPARADLRLRPLGVADLDPVLAIEQVSHSHPWTRGNFTDSLAAGYRLQLLEALPDTRGLRRAERPAPEALGYCVAMPGVDEMHLLNVTVRPDLQGQGLATLLMHDLFEACRVARAQQLWLEVRQGNERARRLYERLGFEAVGRRKAYYPAAEGREDAVVMRLTLDPGASHGLD